jgi:acyl carrier protein
MKIEEFIEKFAYAIETDPGSISAETDYKRLPQWDSLNALSIIAMADVEYGITLSGQDISNAATVADLWSTVCSKPRA